ncbi:MAG: hypothetical protein JXA37_09900 [Chloroflexia bacterium]|nr:hypothetical protein [Chloroflexia bacterium]
MAVWAIAHRGASDKAPENTLVAFQRALELGADALEFDVHLTADGQVVVIHDATVDRTTDGSGEVAEMTLEVLRQLDAGVSTHSRFAGQPIPTLAEVVELTTERIGLFIEVKGRLADLPARLVELIRELGVGERVWLFTAHQATLEELRHLAPEMRVRWREGMEGGDFVLTWPERLTEATLAVYRQRGMQVFTTVKDRTSNSLARQQIARMTQLGIDGIICNRVGLLRDVLDSLQKKA